MEKVKITELRIGNFIHDPNQYGGPLNIIIDSIAPTAETAQWWGGIEPIPLTEEWLINFGIKKEKIPSFEGQDMWAGMQPWSYNDEWLFRGPPNRLHLVGYFNTQIQYVHKLQNIFFALTGKELELK